jgi:hypothetical protein
LEVSVSTLALASEKKGKKMKRTLEDWRDDPEPGDMNDPEYRNEIFLCLKEGGTTPEQLPDPKLRKQYEAWLKQKE